jgi:antitoxin VapB
MNIAKVFTTGRSQAVRLPKEFRLAGKKVGVNRIGEVVILYPLRKGWDILARSLGDFTPDFMVPAPRGRDRRKRL